jgi:tRNA pseudouridine38-40 synthase
MVGEGQISKEEFAAILQSRDRVNAGPTAPPQGLFLRKIRY